MSETIKVAVRIRPLVESEIKRGCQSSVETSSQAPQVFVSDKTFSFNYVFDQDSTQQDVYEGAIKNLVKKLFKGYNVTVLAYGQTGSGKTHTMGSTYNERCADQAEMGVIPRAVKEIFEHIGKTQECEYKVAVSFMELYMENLYDLLSPERQSVDIREDTKGIIIPKLTERSVGSLEGTMECLQLGSSIRVTGATNMNSQSSRSHAVFTISIHQQKIGDPHSATTAKFNLVDLAGSERAGKTGAEGERFKEGVQINTGLLALGNVISALSETRGQVPSYRNSKLTRLLQDSLGGNSVTLMIACVSPADYNILETINTLRYASRAQNIKNKPVVNQDPKSAEIAALKAKVAELQLQLAGQGGPLLSSAAPPAEDTERIHELELKTRKIRQKLTDALGENADIRERLMMEEAALEKMKERVEDLDKGMREQLELADSIVLPESGKAFIETLKKSFSEKMVNLLDELRRSEEEHKAHESMGVGGEADTEIALELREMESVDDLRQMDEYVEKHTDKQSKLNDELKEITKELQFKEQRFLQYAENKVMFSDSLQLKIKYEKQISELEKEKEDLMNSIKQLQISNKNEAANMKQSELLKKNAQIDALKKKLDEQSNIVKQKENAEKKVQDLSREIASMKQAKVRLIKLMKAETEQHKAWVKSREREAAKLRENERKRTNEMHRMAAMHSKQQNVSKRKLEQAVAANKRLKEALLKQKVVRNTRDMRGNKEQIQEFVAHELEVLVSTVDAERSLQLLIEDRAQLTDELAQIRRQTNDQAMMTRRQKVEQEIELRSAQIADLQQKLADTDQESKSKSRWDSVATMADAKVALSCAIRLAADFRREQSDSHQCIIADRERLQEQLMKALIDQEALRSELAKQKEEMRQEIERLDKENREAHQARLQALVQNEEKENIKEENNILRDKLDTILSVTVTPQQRKRRSIHREFEDLNMSSDGKYVGDDDDPARDPDWRKTPLAARLRELKSKNSVFVRKRNAMGEALMKCGCMMKCDSKRCICFRANSACGDQCSCLPTKCHFKLASITYTSDLSSPLNQTYVKEEADTSKNSKKRKVLGETCGGT